MLRLLVAFSLPNSDSMLNMCVLPACILAIQWYVCITQNFSTVCLTAFFRWVSMHERLQALDDEWFGREKFQQTGSH